MFITEVEASWVSSLTSLGAPFGGLLCGLMTEGLGKKRTALLGQTLTFVVGHVLIMAAPSVEYLYVGRFICGICQVFCLIYEWERLDSQTKAFEARSGVGLGWGISSEPEHLQLWGGSGVG